MLNAVHDSRIEPRLRHLAVELAIYADDDGREIYPGIQRLMRALGMAERGVRAALRLLITSGVLDRDGYQGHARRYRFNLEHLARYEPPARQAKQPCTPVQGSKRLTCTPVQGCRQEWQA